MVRLASIQSRHSLEFFCVCHLERETSLSSSFLLSTFSHHLCFLSLFQPLITPASQTPESTFPSLLPPYHLIRLTLWSLGLHQTGIPGRRQAQCSMIGILFWTCGAVCRFFLRLSSVSFHFLLLLSFLWSSLSFLLAFPRCCVRLIDINLLYGNR